MTTDMRIEPQFSIFLVNKQGILATVMGQLAHADVNVMALSLADSGEHGVLRILTDNPDETRKVLEAEHDRWTETDVLVVEIENKQGSFLAVAGKLSDAKVNINYAYCTQGVSGQANMAIFKAVETQQAFDALKKN